MAFELFPDQYRDVRALQNLIVRHRAVCYQLPTGGGKGVIAGFIAQKARENGHKILILVHRKELVIQFMDNLRTVGLDHDVGVVSPQFPATPWAPIQLAMIFSAARRPDFLKTFKPTLVIVDEAHHAIATSWDTVLKAFPDAKILGLTATPRRLDGRGLKAHFDALHCGLTIQQLIDLERLCPIVVKHSPLISRQGVRTTGGDLNKGDLDKKITETVVAAGANAYAKLAPGRRAIFFCVSVRHSKATAEKLREMGYGAEHIDGTTWKGTRDKAMRMFKDGAIDAICNVDIVSEGFDCPGCEVVVDMAPTLSVPRFLQRVGRCLRYEPDKTAMLVDCCGNTAWHGHPTVDRTWDLEDLPTAERRAARKNPAGGHLRVCRDCLTVFEPKSAECPVCGTEHDGRPVREVDAEFVDLPAPSGQAKAEPTMTRAERAELSREVAILMKRGEPIKAWETLKKAGEDAGYDPRWAHIMANYRKIPTDART